jgi:hypothetical protein
MCSPSIVSSLWQSASDENSSAAQGSAPDPAEIERQRFQKEAADQEAFERDAEARRQQADRVAAEQRTGRIGAGKKSIADAFSPYDQDSFYNNAATGYNDFQSQDINTQYQQQLGNLISTLARTGGLNTSARNRGVEALRGQYDDAMRQVPAAGQQYSDSLRTNINDSRNALYSQNDQDPGVDSISSAATSKAAEFAAPTGYSRLANLMIDPSQFAESRVNGIAPGSGGGASATPALFNQIRQARGGGFSVA